MAVLPKSKTTPINTRKKAVPKRVPPATKNIPPEPTETTFTKTENEETILELINKRQRQIIIHSVIYYRMNENLISDKQWDIWARELVKIQKEHPEITKKSVFYEDMKDFDASTGFHLADHPWGMKIAPSLIENHKKYKGVG